MTLTTEQVAQFKEATKPLIKWLNENCHPHVSALVVSTGAELSESVCSVEVLEFLRD